MLERLTIPAVLAVTQLAAAGCASTTPPTDAAVTDTSTVDIAINDATADDASDSGPVTCVATVQPDGGVACVGGGPELFCVGPLGGCVVDDGGNASDACCELVG